MTPDDTSVGFMHLRLSCREPFSGASAKQQKVANTLHYFQTYAQYQVCSCNCLLQPYNNCSHCYLPQARPKIEGWGLLLSLAWDW